MNPSSIDHSNISVKERDSSTGEFTWPLILPFLILQIGITALSILIPQFPSFYAYATIITGVLVAVFSKKILSIVYIAAYLTAIEVFWRMSGANIFYEIGKYGISLLLIIGFLRIHRLKRTWEPVLMLILLCISIPLTLYSNGFSESSRQLISFNLSGPLSLIVCVIFFRQIKLSQNELINISWIICLGIVSILSFALYNTITAKEIVFTSESNYITSGGFGPNQVSAILGLGGTLAFLIAINSKHTISKSISIILLLAFFVQSVLTFSRGGIYNSAICIALVTLHLLKNQKGRIFTWTFILSLGLIAFYIIIPKLDQFTGGKFSDRFTDTSSAGRNEIALAEIQVWLDHPIMGVGPGLGQGESYLYSGRNASAHTEYTRLLAEHGIPGAIVILLMILIAVKAYLHSPGWQSKIWTVVFIAWPLTEMLHAAMRISAISYLFGLASAVWIISTVPANLKNNTKPVIINSAVSLEK